MMAVASFHMCEVSDAQQMLPIEYLDACIISLHVPEHAILTKINDETLGLYCHN